MSDDDFGSVDLNDLTGELQRFERTAHYAKIFAERRAIRVRVSATNNSHVHKKPVLKTPRRIDWGKFGF